MDFDIYTYMYCHVLYSYKKNIIMKKSSSIKKLKKYDAIENNDLIA